MTWTRMTWTRRRKDSPLDALIEATREHATKTAVQGAVEIMTPDEMDIYADRICEEAEEAGRQAYKTALKFRVRANEIRRAERAQLEAMWEQT